MPDYVRTPYVNDPRTLLDLMRLASADRSRSSLARADARAQGIATIGQLIAGTLGQMRQEREQRALQQAAAIRQEQEDAFKRRDQQIREADVLARIADREETTAARREADAAKQREAAYKRGGEVAEEVGYGPMSEMQLDAVMQGPAAGRARYVFGPGTAEGPELQPTQAQQRDMAARRAIEGMGGTLGPNGQVVMPPKPEREPNPTEASLAMLAAKGDKMAAQALATLQRIRQTPTQKNPIPVMGPDGRTTYVLPENAVGQLVPTTRELPTEDERKAAGFFKQMGEAITIIDELENQLTEKDLYQMTLPQEEILGLINRGEMSEAAKRYLRAFEQFTEARMRPVSGAAISDSEFARDRRTYARQFRETPKLAEDRKKARLSALDTLRARAMRALPKASNTPENDPLGIRPKGGQ